jgi:predicted ABC-type ATPase
MSSKPRILVYAGPNGSGKSMIAGKVPRVGAYVNADDLKRERGLSDIEAAKMAEAQRNALLGARASFTFETVMSTDRNLILLQKAKESGYSIECIYVLTCSADINVARVRARVAAGGHGVPEDKIRGRYERALALLPDLIGACGRIIVFDNSLQKVSVVFEKAPGGKGEIFPTALWPREKLLALTRTAP